MEEITLTGRPLDHEAAAYYFTYINKTTGEDMPGLLEKQLDEAVELFGQIPEGQSLHRYEPGKWSIRQLLNHVTDTERALVFRALWFARGFTEPLPSYDQNVAADGADADRVSWASHVEEFRRVRLATISFFGHLPPNAWLRQGTASGNPFTVRALAFIIAGHLTHHIDIMREKYLSER